jgi:hypothetical protein
MNDETPLARGAPRYNTCKTDRITDFRTPLWRGRDKPNVKKLRKRYAAYVHEFELYVEQRRAA